MLPTSHFMITAVCAVPVAVASGRDAPGVATWAVLAGVVSAAVDLDVYGFVIHGSRRDPRLRPFRSMAEIYRRFPRFMETIACTGILRKAMISHLVICGGLCLATRLLAPALFIPVAVAAATHLASDIPNIIRALRGNRKP
jgi:hypothetical protein